MVRNVEMTHVQQLNLHHSKAASALLCRRWDVNQYDIALLQEPWIFKSKIAGLTVKQGTLYYDQTTDRPRACLIVRKGTKALFLPQLSSPDLAVARVGTAVGRFIIGSAYLPYDAPDGPPSQELNRLVEHCERKGEQLILGCDANAHNTVWGSSDTNRRGEQLLNFLVDKRLDILNRGDSPTFFNARRREIIDITICSMDIRARVRNWEVAADITMSDHNAITFSIDYGTRRGGTAHIRNIRNTDISYYKSVLEEKLSNMGECRPLRNCTEADRTVNDLTAIIRESFFAACPAVPVIESDSTP